MAEIKRSQIFGKLNPLAYKAIEGATVFCKMRGNSYVELVHWVNQLVQSDKGDFQIAIEHFGIDKSVLAKNITAALDALPRGASSLSDFSAHIELAIKEAWMVASLMFGRDNIRGGDLLLAILKSRDLSLVFLDISREFNKIKIDDLSDNFDAIFKDGVESELRSSASGGMGSAAPGEASDAMAPPQMGKKEALKRFTVDLTAQAKTGKMDPIEGRDEEIRKIIDILMRRRQNNPIITGEAGVGKTAVVEGFAQRIAAGDVPPSMRNVSLLSLDIGLLQAGASMKGEFENRLKQVIEEVETSDTPIILFIDEAHTLIGAGGAAGQNDAANLLKPALARGMLRTIAATTWAEYKKYFEKDPALSRRFQNIVVGEPDDDKAFRMVRGVAKKLQEHHKVEILDDAIRGAVVLSRRYLPARQLPDKAVSVLDTACARVAVTQHAEPAEREDCRRRVTALELEISILKGEEKVGIEHLKKLAELEDAMAAQKQALAAIDARWQTEKELVDRVVVLRRQLRGEPADAAEPAESTGAAPAEPAPATASPAADSADSKTEAAAASPAADTADSKTEAATASPAADSADSKTEAAVPAPEAAPPKNDPSDPTDTPPPEDPAALLAELTEKQAKLAKLQGDAALISPAVDERSVAVIIEEWTGIPVKRMVKNELAVLLDLAGALAKRVVGQDVALETIAKRVQTARAGMSDPGKPVGVFMLAGSSGIGKTETALALAETLYGGERNLITINMSEYQEAHTVSLLKGSPPGYVGYGQGGVLTEAVRKRPYSVVLLDEVEKAHRDVHEIFFQVFDKGRMEDAEGVVIDFRNTVILLTTNAGGEELLAMCQDPDLLPEPEAATTAIRPALLKVFPPALLGRLVVVPYYPLGEKAVKNIIRMKLDHVRQRVEEGYNAEFSYSDELLDLVYGRSMQIESGARMVDAVITNTILPEISAEFLRRVMEGGTLKSARVGVKDGEIVYELS